MGWNTHNGNWGAGMVRSFYPESMGGPFGSPLNPLPDFTSNPAFSTERMLSSSTPYTGSGKVLRRMGFGQRMLTPGGMGVSPSWGFTAPSYSFSSPKRRRKSSKVSKRRKSRKVSKRRKSRKFAQI